MTCRTGAPVHPRAPPRSTTVAARASAPTHSRPPYRSCASAPSRRPQRLPAYPVARPPTPAPAPPRAPPRLSRGGAAGRVGDAAPPYPPIAAHACSPRRRPAYPVAHPPTPAPAPPRAPPRLPRGGAASRVGDAAPTYLYERRRTGAQWQPGSDACAPPRAQAPPSLVPTNPDTYLSVLPADACAPPRTSTPGAPQPGPFREDLRSYTCTRHALQSSAMTASTPSRMRRTFGASHSKTQTKKQPKKQRENTYSRSATTVAEVVASEEPAPQRHRRTQNTS